MTAFTPEKTPPSPIQCALFFTSSSTTNAGEITSFIPEKTAFSDSMCPILASSSSTKNTGGITAFTLEKTPPSLMHCFFLPIPPLQTPCPVFNSSSSTTNTGENIPSSPPQQTPEKSPPSHRRKHRLLRFNDPPQTPPSLMPLFYLPPPPPQTLKKSPHSYRRKHRLLRFNNPPQTPPSLMPCFYVPPPPPKTPEKSPLSHRRRRRLLRFNDPPATTNTSFVGMVLPPSSSTAKPRENTAFSDALFTSLLRHHKPRRKHRLLRFNEPCFYLLLLLLHQKHQRKHTSPSSGVNDTVEVGYRQPPRSGLKDRMSPFKVCGLPTGLVGSNGRDPEHETQMVSHRINSHLLKPCLQMVIPEVLHFIICSSHLYFFSSYSFYGTTLFVMLDEEIPNDYLNHVYREAEGFLHAKDYFYVLNICCYRRWSS
ncbi:hypothetical protein SLEP1_g57474 [Rubroshorea leprosula]|uniref:Uncharacterized protein n=1 Tax=Rubroshorea leprosula TaxID=152421 RepID=A0AAV5MML1_9ROSI|nr:hypothetical protein SLEP1_g57474 [Rubroshorea leprosula]